MKKIILLFIVLGFFTANAQKITQQTLQGKWDLTALEARHSEGFYLDFIQEEVKFSPDFESGLDAEAKKNVIEGLKQIILVMKNATMSYTDNRFTRFIANENSEGTFSVIDKDGKTYLQAIDVTGKEETTEIYLKDGLLYINISNEALFIFTKQ